MWAGAGRGRVVLLPVVVLAAGLLAGCASRCTGDPATDSVGCASQALATGSYESATTDRAADLSATEAEADAARARNAGLADELAGLRARRKRIERRLAELELTLRAIEARLGAADTRVREASAAVQSLRTDVLDKPMTEQQVEAEEKGLAILSQQVQRLAIQPADAG